MANQADTTILEKIISLIAVGFGLLTIKAGGAVLFGDAAARLDAGNYVPFVLWFNFLAGFAYVIAGVGIWGRRQWSMWLSAAIALATSMVFVVFGMYVLAGGVFEQRTVIAMSLRSGIWISIGIFSWYRSHRTHEMIST